MRPAINLKKITQAARDLAVSSERQRNAFLTALTDEIARAQKKFSPQMCAMFERRKPRARRTHSLCALNSMTVELLSLRKSGFDTAFKKRHR